MNRDPSQLPDVLAWVQPFVDKAEPSPTTIPFDFLSHNHIDALLIKIWAARLISTYPPSFQGQVTKLIDTVSMLYHEIRGHLNSPLVITETRVLEKQRATLTALEALLCNPANCKGRNKVWVRQNVIEVLLNPPPPPQSWVQRSFDALTSSLTSTVTFFTSASYTTTVLEEQQPGDDKASRAETTQISTTETPLVRRRPVPTTATGGSEEALSRKPEGRLE